MGLCAFDLKQMSITLPALNEAIQAPRISLNLACECELHIRTKCKSYFRKGSWSKLHEGQTYPGPSYFG